jgi:hypothetical protein
LKVQLLPETGQGPEITLEGARSAPAAVEMANLTPQHFSEGAGTRLDSKIWERGPKRRGEWVKVGMKSSKGIFFLTAMQRNALNGLAFQSQSNSFQLLAHSISTADAQQ